MSTSLILGFLWVVAAALTAMLPMRKQYLPGLPLLIAAPFLVGYMGYEHGIWITLVALLAIASMMRNPLIYLYKKARGLPVQLPPELRDRER